MDILIILIPLALLLGGIFLALFLWATSKGQYDDLDTPAQRILYEDTKYEENTKVKGDESHVE